MFCIRSWLPILLFISNASPIYIALFLTTYYYLQRPCVYCSLLLCTLIFSLFDFTADWFELRWQPMHSATETISSLISGNGTVTDAILETASLAVAALNGTGGSLASAAIDGVKRRSGGSLGSVTASANITGFEALRAAAEKWQLRIPCLDVILRL
ncbi:hypothetical protein LTR53_011229 [Teratosphaeriaceae sp. CCFEE 6253]|nr:hypothetical protein LTR53_011229 [Teratosphaeriaceae sp. CCFEE 6253]